MRSTRSTIRGDVMDPQLRDIEARSISREIERLDGKLSGRAATSLFVVLVFWLWVPATVHSLLGTGWWMPVTWAVWALISLVSGAALFSKTSAEKEEELARLKEKLKEVRGW